MFTTLGLPYRIIGMAVLIAAIYGFGYYLGYMPEHDARVSFQSAVAEAGRIQADKVKELDLQHQKDLEKDG